jgi:hypothetical protein
MLQLIGLLAISWFFIWLFNKESISVLGLTLTKQRLKYALIFFVVSALCAASSFLLKMIIAKEAYALSELITMKLVLIEIWNQFRSVLTEELICRGALLYILIKKIGQTKAILISSILFAALHWFNAGVWGNLMQMIIVFSFTFTMGLLLAYAFARTVSLWIPFAIHFGWNLTQNYIFPESAAGNHIFVLAAPAPVVTVSYFAFFTMLLFPKIAVLVFDYLIVKSTQWKN